MRRKLLAITGLAVLLAGCGGSSNNSGSSFLFGVNAIPNYGTVSVIANATSILTNAQYAVTSSAWVSTASGNGSLVYLTNSGNIQLASLTTNLATNGYYVVYAIGNTSTQTLMVVPLALQSIPTSGDGRLVFANASVQQPSADVYVTAPGASISGVVPTETSVTPFSSGVNIDEPAGTYEVRFTQAGTQNVIGDFATVVVPSSGPSQVQVLAITDSQTGSATPQQTLPVISSQLQPGSPLVAKHVHSIVSLH